MLRELLLGLFLNVSLEITDSVILIEHLSSKSSAVYLEIKILSAQLDGAAGTKKSCFQMCSFFRCKRHCREEAVFERAQCGHMQRF